MQARVKFTPMLTNSNGCGAWYDHSFQFSCNNVERFAI
jgi:hypothetical protein